MGVMDFVSFARNSTATFFDANGVFRVAAANALRRDNNPSTKAALGFLSEAAGTNISRNPRAEGASVGGAQPTGWNTATSGNGLTATVTAVGVEDGIPYVDTRFSGTTTAAAVIVLGGGTGTGAAQNEIWTSSFHARVVAGSLTGLTSIQHLLWESPSNINGAGPITLDARALREARHRLTRTLTAANTNAIFHQLRANVANGQTIDVTIRFALPQLERSPVATSVILPPAGTTAASNRVADSASVPLDIWFRQDVGSVVAEIDVPVRSGLGIRGIFSIDRDSGGANRILVFLNNAGNVETRVAGPNATVQGVFTIPSSAAPRVKVGFTWNLDGAVLAVNGQTQSHPRPTELPANPTAFRIANGQGGTIPLRGHLLDLTYFPRLLTTAELNELTAL